MFSGDLVMDGPETGEYLAEKWEFSYQLRHARLDRASIVHQDLSS